MKFGVDPAEWREVVDVPRPPGAAAVMRADSTTGRHGIDGTAPGAAGNGKDEEHPSGIEEYLINEQNGIELTGLDATPKAVPPVIGGD